MATLPVLLDGFEIEDEHMVMAEALFTFLVMLAMLLILRRGRVSWPTALLAGVIAGCAVDVRTEGLPLLAVFAAFLLLRSPKGAPERNGRQTGAAGWPRAPWPWLRHASPRVHGMVSRLDRRIHADWL